MKKQIRQEVESILPLDDLEQRTKQDVLDWIDSGAELCRIKKPATPNKHLVSYFVVVDGDHLLLVDHINAQLWLPTGGHVEPGEHPRAAALREADEELALKSKFLLDGPILITSTMTVGKTAGHTDVSLWYVLEGKRGKDILHDSSEFNEARWFQKDSIPLQKTDPNMERFIAKLYVVAT